MTRYHATAAGNIPFTAAEEAERDTEEVAHAAGADDRAAEEVRSKRNSLIAATDYYALTDVTMDSTVTAYRQALRDISTQAGFPNEITWPVAP